MCFLLLHLTASKRNSVVSVSVSKIFWLLLVVVVLVCVCAIEKLKREIQSEFYRWTSIARWIVEYRYLDFDERWNCFYTHNNTIFNSINRFANTFCILGLLGISRFDGSTLFLVRQNHNEFCEMKNANEITMNSASIEEGFTVIIDHSIAIQIGFFDHIIDFCFRQSFTQIGHDVTQFRRRYQTIVVLIEHSVESKWRNWMQMQSTNRTLLKLPECLFELIFIFGRFHFLWHHQQKFVEFNRTVAIDVDLIDHVAQFILYSRDENEIKRHEISRIGSRGCSVQRRLSGTMSVSCIQNSWNENCIWYLPLGRCPKERKTIPSSAIVMVPSSSLSKSMNASLNSEQQTAMKRRKTMKKVWNLFGVRTWSSVYGFGSAVGAINSIYSVRLPDDSRPRRIIPFWPQKVDGNIFRVFRKWNWQKCAARGWFAANCTFGKSGQTMMRCWKLFDGTENVFEK